MRRALLAVAIVAAPLAGEARRLTAAQFLASAHDDYALRNSRELTAYFDSADRSTPYLDRVEIRTETSRFEVRRQRFALRIYLKGWGETSASRQLTEVTRRCNRAADRAAFNAALRRRYELLLEHVELHRLVDLQRQLLAVHKDRLTVLRRQSTTLGDYDATALVRAENKYIEQRLVMVRLQDRVTKNSHELALAAGHPVTLALSGAELLPMAEIAKLARAVDAGGKVDNVYLQQRRLRIRRADLRYRLEVAKNRDYLSFFKVEFDAADYDRPERAFSVGLALKMPFIHPDRDDANRRKVRFLQEKLRLERERRAASERIVSLSRSLLRLLAQQRILLDRKHSGDAEVSFKRHLSMEGISPLTLLEIRESILEGDVRLAEIDSAIRQRHVALLDVLGRLGQGPLRNLISAKQEVVR